jgi:TPR repeat protein
MACHKADPRACMELAQMYKTGIGTSQNFKEAQSYFEMACKGKNPIACDKAGELERINHHIHACEMSESESCFYLGAKFRWGRVVPRDNPQAVKYLEKSCDLNHPRGCEWLAQSLIWEGVVEDRKSVTLRGGPKKERIINLFKKACHLTNRDACYTLGDYYARGIHVEQSLPSAFEFFKKSCDLSSDYGCYRLGNYHEEGIFVKKNQKKAKAIYKKACVLQSHDACKKLINI